MAVLKLYEYPHPVLRKKCEKVGKVDDELRTFLRDMLETMYADKGCGLAAPQVGVSKRIVVLDYATEDDDEKKPMFLVNPEIIWKSDEKINCFGEILAQYFLNSDREIFFICSMSSIDFSNRI